jgi:glycosyltransferase involved in cell wall biosynthesis
MKILFISPRFHTNQIYWIKALQKHGHSVNMYVINKSKTENYQALQPSLLKISKISKMIMNMFGSGGSNIYRGFPPIFRYFQLIKRGDANLVIIRDVGRWLSILTIIVCRLLQKNALIYSQTDLSASRSISRLFVYSFILYLTKGAWITPVRSDHPEDVRLPKKLYYVPFAVNIDDSKNGIPKRSNINILSIGKYVDRKNHYFLVNAVKRLKNIYPSIQLTIIGECSTPQQWDYFAKLQSFILLNKLSNSIKLLSNVEYERISSYYKIADLFVLPASNEPASISILEAMGYGIPAICSTSCGTRHYIESGKSGYIFEDKDEIDLSAKILSSLERNNYLKMIEYIKYKTSNEISMNNYINHLTRVLKKTYGMDL